MIFEGHPSRSTFLVDASQRVTSRPQCVYATSPVSSRRRHEVSLSLVNHDHMVKNGGRCSDFFENLLSQEVSSVNLDRRDRSTGAYGDSLATVLKRAVRKRGIYLLVKQLGSETDRAGTGRSA